MIIMPLLREEFYVIGYPKHQVTDGKLISKANCLKNMFYNLRAGSRT